jgi:hypothetical protein
MLLSLLDVGLSASFARQVSPKEHKKASGLVTMGGDFFRVGNTCWFVIGTFGAGDYFRDVKARQSQDGVKYFKGKNEISDFPNESQIILDLGLVQCKLDEDVSKHPTAPVSDDINSLVFKVKWKRNGQVREARVTSSSIVTKPFAEEGKEWQARFTIDSSGVPLYDDLVVLVLGEKGSLLTRLSGNVRGNSTK